MINLPDKLKNPKTLRLKQSLFAYLIAHLITWAYDVHGFEITCGDFYDQDKDGGHKSHSLHHQRLAADLNLFKGGLWLKLSEDHKLLGEYWEKLHPLCCWGGRFGDGNHYSVTHGGMK